jgi:hypothetical protein
VLVAIAGGLSLSCALGVAFLVIRNTALHSRDVCFHRLFVVIQCSIVGAALTAAVFVMLDLRHSLHLVSCGSFDTEADATCRDAAGACGIAPAVLTSGSADAIVKVVSYVLVGVLGINFLSALIPSLPSDAVRQQIPQIEADSAYFKKSPYAPDGITRDQSMTLRRVILQEWEHRNRKKKQRESTNSIHPPHRVEGVVASENRGSARQTQAPQGQPHDAGSGTTTVKLFHMNEALSAHGGSTIDEDPLPHTAEIEIEKISRRVIREFKGDDGGHLRVNADVDPHPKSFSTDERLLTQDLRLSRNVEAIAARVISAHIPPTPGAPQRV